MRLSQRELYYDEECNTIGCVDGAGDDVQQLACFCVASSGYVLKLNCSLIRYDIVMFPRLLNCNDIDNSTRFTKEGDCCEDYWNCMADADKSERPCSGRGLCAVINWTCCPLANERRQNGLRERHWKCCKALHRFNPDC